MSRTPKWSALKTALLVAVVGVPAFLLLAAFTQGAVLVPIVGALLLAPLLLLHYLLWGRSLSREVAEEAAQQAREAAARVNPDLSPAPRPETTHVVGEDRILGK